MENAIEQVTDKLESWGNALIGLAPNIIVAILVLLTAWLLAKLAKRGARKILARLKVSPAIAGLMSTIVAIFVVSIGFFVALGVLQLDKALTSLLAGAGVLGLVIGFALQDSAADVLAGIMLAVRKPFEVGELIEAQDAQGRVYEVNLRATLLDTADGQRVILPNREVFTSKVTNYSRIGRRRVAVPVGVSYGEDLDHVAQVTKTAVEAVSTRIESTDVDVIYTGFGGSSIDLEARFWIPFENRERDYSVAFSEGLKRIKKAYDAEDISIPFPIRTLDFGIKGGEPLDAMLASGTSESTASAH